MKNSSQLFAYARKTATATLFAVFLLTVASCTKLRSGQSFVAESDGINYRYEVIVSNHNYVRVTPVSGPEAVTGAINIPSTVRHEDYTYVVTQIGANAFSNYTGITSVTIPGTVSIIETNAFRNCQSLTTVNVSNSISTIDAYAFENCSQLQTFHFATSLSTLGQGCFRGFPWLLIINHCRSSLNYHSRSRRSIQRLHIALQPSVACYHHADWQQSICPLYRPAKHLFRPFCAANWRQHIL